MANVLLCPNCGGQKTLSKPPYIAGNINTWVGDTSLYPCPTCDGRGWIHVDAVPQVEFDSIKSAALLSMETSESLMDECANRANRIKELETALKRTTSGEHVADKEIERMRTQLELSTKEFTAVVRERDSRISYLESYHNRVRDVHQAREIEFATVCDRHKTDLELLDVMLKIVNPMIVSGHYAQPMAYSQWLSSGFSELCRTVVQFRRKHNIVG